MSAVWGPGGHSWRLHRDAGPRIGRKQGADLELVVPASPAVYRVPPCTRLLPVHCAVHEDSTGEGGDAESSRVSCSSLTAGSDQSGSLSPAPCTLGQSSQAALMLAAPANQSGWLLLRQGLDCVAREKPMGRWVVVRM